MERESLSGDSRSKGSSAAGTETKAPKSESVETVLECLWEIDVGGRRSTRLVSGTGARTGEARGVEGANKVAKRSSLSSLVFFAVIVAVG